MGILALFKILLKKYFFYQAELHTQYIQGGSPGLADSLQGMNL